MTNWHEFLMLSKEYVGYDTTQRKLHFWRGLPRDAFIFYRMGISYRLRLAWRRYWI